jgi:phage-related tail protein
MRRVVGIFLVAYGLAGLLLVAGGGALVANSSASLNSLTGVLDTQRQVLVRSLDATATFLADARRGTTNVATSLTSTIDSARATATLSRSLAAAMDQLNVASTLTILGVQPFVALGQSFAQVSQQAAAMAGSLDATADALGTNRTDLQQMGDDLAAIQVEIDTLSTQLSPSGAVAADLAAATRALDVSRMVLIGLLAWLAIQAGAAAVLGLALLWPRRRP